MSRRHRQRLARGPIDWREPLTQHELNVCRQFLFLAAPGRYGGPSAWDVVNGLACTLANFTSGFGWTPLSYPGGWGSLSFNGAATPSSVNLPKTFSLSGSTGWSLLWWAQLATGVTQAWLFGDNTSFQGVLFNQGTSLQFVNNAGSSWAFTNATSFTSMTHYALVCPAGAGNSTITLYVNGKPLQTLTPSGNATWTWNYIGRRSDTAIPFKGWIPHATLYNYGVPASIVQQDYILSQQGYLGVLRRRRRVAYSVPSGGTLFIRSCSDAPATSDSVTRLFSGSRTLTDAPQTTDAASRLFTGTRSLADTPSTVDSVNRLTSLARSATDAPQTADSIQAVKAKFVTAGDAPSTTDSVTRQFTGTRSISDAPSTTDVVSRVFTGTRTTTDTPATADSITASKVKLVTVSDAPSTADSVSRVLTLARTAADAPSTSDSIFRSVVLARLVTDHATTADTISVIIVRAGTAALRRVLIAPASVDNILIAPASVDTLLRVPASVNEMQQRNLEADAGDDVTLAVEVRPVPSGGIAGWTIACEISDFSGTVLATLTTANAQQVQILDGPGGNANVYLSDTLTGTTLGVGHWNYRVRRTDSSQITALVRGRLKLR